MALQIHRVMTPQRRKIRRRGELLFALLQGESSFCDRKQVSEEKLALLREKIACGEYQVNIENLSAKMLEDEDFLRKLLRLNTDEGK
ncbi:MAG: flagellar biosynthesis anti-sigma factor FlgM [Deltaproteobacteria bacterium]|nr:flagellar biosynthesis anti-sigma factor FlgM [Deltaproteobacteria bacterium]